MTAPPIDNETIHPTKNWIKRGHTRAEPERNEGTDPNEERDRKMVVIVMINWP